MSNNNITFEEVIALLDLRRKKLEVISNIHDSEEDEDALYFSRQKRKRNNEEEHIKTWFIAFKQQLIRRTLKTLQLIHYDIFF